MSPQTAPRSPLRPWRRVEKNLRKLHRQGLHDPRLHDLDDLVAIARKLSNKATDRECVEEALVQGIDACWGRSRESTPTLRDTMRLWFGLSAVDDPAAPTTRRLSSARRHKSAWEYLHHKTRAKGETPQEAESTFRTSRATARYEELAKTLVELEQRADSPSSPPTNDAADEATPSPDKKPEPETAEPTPAGKDIPDNAGADDVVDTAVQAETSTGTFLARHRGRVAIAAVCALLLALGGYIVASQSTSPPQISPAAQLEHLEAAASNQLSLAATPVPGTKSATLGYGDSVGGRRTYPYGEPEVLPPTRPTLDSLVDVPDPEPILESVPNPSGPRYHTIDERQFLTVRADGENTNGIIPMFAWGHGALVTTDSSRVTVGIWVSNNARPTHQGCRNLVGPNVATNVRVRVSIWNSGNYHRHVVRAWIEAGARTVPTWITDAVPVLTTKSSELYLEPRYSSDVIGKVDYGTIPPPGKQITTNSIMLPQGYLLAGNGRLAPCEANRHYLSLVFAQRKPETILSLP